ncbi:hypothetical protein ACLB2K_001778 [Fragaria x ananassa]
MNGHNDLGPIQIGSVLWSSPIRVTCLAAGMMTSRWLRHRRMRQKWLQVATVVGPIPFWIGSPFPDRPCVWWGRRPLHAVRGLAGATSGTCVGRGCKAATFRTRSQGREVDVVCENHYALDQIYTRRQLIGLAGHFSFDGGKFGCCCSGDSVMVGARPGVGSCDAGSGEEFRVHLGLRLVWA